MYSQEGEKPTLYGKMPYENCFEFPGIHNLDARHSYHRYFKRFLIRKTSLLLGFVKTNKSKINGAPDV